MHLRFEHGFMWWELFYKSLSKSMHIYSHVNCGILDCGIWKPYICVCYGLMIMKNVTAAFYSICQFTFLTCPSPKEFSAKQRLQCKCSMWRRVWCHTSLYAMWCKCAVCFDWELAVDRCFRLNRVWIFSRLWATESGPRLTSSAFCVFVSRRFFGGQNNRWRRNLPRADFYSCKIK